MSIIGLPKETQYEIFSYLSFRELMHSRIISKKYQQIVDGYFFDVWERIKNIPAGDSACVFKNQVEAIEDKFPNDCITKLFRRLFTKCEANYDLRFCMDSSMNVEKFQRLQKIQDDMVKNFSFEKLIALREVSEDHKASIDLILRDLWEELKVMPSVADSAPITHLKTIVEETEKDVKKSEDRSVIALFRGFFAKYRTCSVPGFDEDNFVMRLESFATLQKNLIHYDAISGCSIS
ncbi:MAG: F-box protein [Chlamydiota bacterium]